MRYYIIILMLFLFGCNPVQGRPLNYVEEAILMDYLDWLHEDQSIVQARALERGLDHDLTNLFHESWYAEYRAIDETDSKLVGMADIKGKRVYIFPNTNMWQYILEDYLIEDDIWIHHNKLSYAASVLCHENAHLLEIEPHEDVTEIDKVCRKVVLDTGRELI